MLYALRKKKQEEWMFLLIFYYNFAISQIVRKWVFYQYFHQTSENKRCHLISPQEETLFVTYYFRPRMLYVTFFILFMTRIYCTSDKV